ncbi:MAG: lysophospholipase L1-like esterase, partial [Myxococcota bacterium]
SANAQMPGQLRLLESDKLERSPHVGWSVAPGEHELTVTVVPPLAWATVDGVIVDIRSDVPLDFVTGAAQVMCVTDSVAGVGRLSVETIHEETAAALSSTFWWADLLGVPALILLVIGLSLLLVAATRVTFSKRALWRAARKGLRAHTLVLVWLGFWAAGRLWGFKWGDEPGQVALGAIATTFSVINLAQVFRQSDAAAGIGRRAMAFVVLLVIFVGGVEGVGQLQPEWRHRWTTAWNHQLGPQFYYVQDPMIRRLNPWFIDQRFKRRDFAPRHPDTTRVVVFGGSQTYGWGIPAMDRMAFSDQLERSLHDRGHTDLEVLNAAFPGVKTSTGLRWFASNLLRYDPDIVVINFVVNEFMNVDQFHVWSGEQPKDASLASTVVGAMPERWRGNIMGNHLSQIIVADVYEIFAMEQCLRWWVDIARERGIEVVFSIEPTNLYVESGGDSIMREETSLGNAQEVYRRLGKELSVPVYDVLPHFVAEHENLWFYDTMHMSRLGHKVFAENLAALIESELLEQ